MMYTPKDLADLLKTDTDTIEAMNRERLLPRPAVENGYITRWDVRSINRWIGYHNLDTPVSEGQSVLDDATQLLEPCDGHLVKVADFYDRYSKLACLNNQQTHSIKFVIGALRQSYLVGHGPGKCNYIANVRWCKPLEAGCGEYKPQPSIPFVLSESGRLVRAGGLKLGGCHIPLADIEVITQAKESFERKRAAGKPLSPEPELIEAIQRLRDDHHTYQRIADLIGVSPPTVYKWINN